MFQIVSEAMTKGNASGSLDVLPNPNAAALKRAERWLADRLARGESGITSEAVTVSPELALLLLKLNAENRKLREGRVAVYAADIQAGRWAFNGEAIIICSDRIMASGQHRCHAVIRAGKAIETIIVFGAPPEARKTVDSGEKKTTADRLTMDGAKNCTTTAAAAKAIILIDKYGRIKTGIQPSQTEVLEFVDQHPELVESVDATKSSSRWIASPSVLAAAHFLLSRVDRDAAQEFVAKLISGENLARTNPMMVLREKFRNESRLTPEERIRAIYLTWNNWRNGRSMKIIKLPAVERGFQLPELV